MEITEAQIEKLIAPLVSRVIQLEKQQLTLTDLAGNLGSANLAQELPGIVDRLNHLEGHKQQHPGGLCAAETCVLCADTRTTFAKKQSEALVANRREIFDKLTQAAKLEDLTEQSNLLGKRFMDIESGKPGPQMINLPGGERLTLALPS